MTAAWPSSPGPTPGELLELERLRQLWGAAYSVGYTIKYHAIRKQGGQSVSATSLEGLESAIRASWKRDRDGITVPSRPPWDLW